MSRSTSWRRRESKMPKRVGRWVSIMTLEPTALVGDPLFLLKYFLVTVTNQNLLGVWLDGVNLSEKQTGLRGTRSELQWNIIVGKLPRSYLFSCVHFFHCYLLCMLEDYSIQTLPCSETQPLLEEPLPQVGSSLPGVIDQQPMTNGHEGRRGCPFCLKKGTNLVMHFMFQSLPRTYQAVLQLRLFVLSSYLLCPAALALLLWKALLQLIT